MSGFELPLATQIRLPSIKAGLLSKVTRNQIGQTCHVTERTIRRDIELWSQTDDFINWIRTVWLDKYGKVSDEKVFEQATKILIRSMELKIFARVKEEQSEGFEVTEDEDYILNRAANILNTKLAQNSGSQRQSGSLH